MISGFGSLQGVEWGMGGLTTPFKVGLQVFGV